MPQEDSRKVTAIVTHGDNILLIKHPFAGFQLPAGTVETGESFLEAVIREVAEETGLTDISLANDIGEVDVDLPDGYACLLETTTLHSRPDEKSFDWAKVPGSSWVKILRIEGNWSQVNFSEPDKLPDPFYDTYSLTGWVRSEILAKSQKRRFFHFVSNKLEMKAGKVFADSHTFEVLWFPLSGLPELIPPQDEWLKFALSRMNAKDIENLRGGS